MTDPAVPAPAEDPPRIHRRRRLAAALRALSARRTAAPVAERIRELAGAARITAHPDLDESDLLARLDLPEAAPPEVATALAAILLTLLPGRRP